MSHFDRFTDQWAVLLTSYRRDGSPVGTPVSVAAEGERAFIRSPGNAWKVRRMRRDPRVLLAPCTPRGRPTGPAVPAVARPLAGEDAEHAARALRRKHPVLQGVLVPLAHRVLRCGTAYFELRAPAYPEVMPPSRIVPYAAGADPAASRSFYTEVFGLEVLMEDPVLGLGSPANPSAQVLIPPRGFEDPQPDFGIDVGDLRAVDAAHAAAVERGLRVVYPLRDEPWGVRRFFVEDPGGSIVNVLAHIR